MLKIRPIAIEMVKNVTIAEDVYQRLKDLKREGESFSDLIRRLLRTRGAISELAVSSALTSEEWAEMRHLREEQAREEAKRTESLRSQEESK